MRLAAPTAESETLQDIFQAHVNLDKDKRERSDGGVMGDLEWSLTAFIVLVREDWRTKPGGLSFVFTDEEKDSKIEKFFFQVEDAYMVLSSVSFGMRIWLQVR